MWSRRSKAILMQIRGTRNSMLWASDGNLGSFSFALHGFVRVAAIGSEGRIERLAAGRFGEFCQCPHSARLEAGSHRARRAVSQARKARRRDRPLAALRRARGNARVAWLRQRARVRGAPVRLYAAADAGAVAGGRGQWSSCRRFALRSSLESFPGRSFASSRAWRRHRPRPNG